jgi:hypothetical protein
MGNAASTSMLSGTNRARSNRWKLPTLAVAVAIAVLLLFTLPAVAETSSMGVGVLPGVVSVLVMQLFRWLRAVLVWSVFRQPRHWDWVVMVIVVECLLWVCRSSGVVFRWRKRSSLRCPGKTAVANLLLYGRKGRAWLSPDSWDSGKLHGVMAPKLGVRGLRVA